jgi:Spore Coat Protein U domain
MKKLLLSVALVAASFGASAAGSDSKPFNVKVALTSACKMSTIGDVLFAYTSLQAGAQVATGGALTVTCTNLLDYTLKFDSATGAATSSGTFGTVNLAYTLGLSAAGGTGDGTAKAYNITGGMIPLQAGTCASASCNDTDATHTLYVVY